MLVDKLAEILMGLRTDISRGCVFAEVNDSDKELAQDIIDMIYDDMGIHIVEWQYDGEYGMNALFSNKEKAQQWCDKFNEIDPEAKYTTCEWGVNPDLDEHVEWFLQENDDESPTTD